MQPEPERLRRSFEDVRLWIFDLDNTLYPARCNLFAQVDARMSQYIQGLLGLDATEAKRVQKQLYYEHGTTLAGLMREHDIDPTHYMDFVHDIDLSPVEEAPRLLAALRQLPGKRFIFTNGSQRHAERIAGKLGVLEAFDGIFDVAAGGYVPKPKPESFARFMAFSGVESPCRGAMFEDLPHNLEPAHALGLTTVLVHSTYLDHPSQHALHAASALPGYIDFATGDLTEFLEGMVDAAFPDRHSANGAVSPAGEERS
jgi:putative hydrolase of the HAD superfamily